MSYGDSDLIISIIARSTLLIGDFLIRHDSVPHLTTVARHTAVEKNSGFSEEFGSEIVTHACVAFGVTSRVG